MCFSPDGLLFREFDATFSEVFGRTSQSRGKVLRALSEKPLSMSELAAAGKPLLGICVGLQILFEGSEESPEASGLGIFSGTVRRLPTKQLKIPQIGWNSLNVIAGVPCGLFDGLPQNTYVYFVHGYHAVPKDKGIIAATVDYDGEITAAISKGNVAATQFHPEKSGDAGLKILDNFLRS